MNVIEGLLYFFIASLIAIINIHDSFVQSLFLNIFVAAFIMPSIIYICGHYNVQCVETAWNYKEYQEIHY